MTFRLLLAGAALAAGSSPALTQMSAELTAALRNGQVGERFDGYLGFSSSPTAHLQRQVQAINIERRSLYVGLASKRGVTTQMAGIATGCELLANIGVGQAYMLQDGIWRRREQGQPAPRPSYCG